MDPCWQPGRASDYIVDISNAGGDYNEPIPPGWTKKNKNWQTNVDVQGHYDRTQSKDKTTKLII